MAVLMPIANVKNVTKLTNLILSVKTRKQAKRIRILNSFIIFREPQREHNRMQTEEKKKFKMMRIED